MSAVSGSAPGILRFPDLPDVEVRVVSSGIPDQSSLEPCTICLEPMLLERERISYHSHTFHQVCMDQWFLTHGDELSAPCPICRVDISIPENLASTIREMNRRSVIPGLEDRAQSAAQVARLERENRLSGRRFNAWIAFSFFGSAMAGCFLTDAILADREFIDIGFLVTAVALTIFTGYQALSTRVGGERPRGSELIRYRRVALFYSCWIGVALGASARIGLIWSNVI